MSECLIWLVFDLGNTDTARAGHENEANEVAVLGHLRHLTPIIANCQPKTAPEGRQMVTNPIRILLEE